MKEKLNEINYYYYNIYGQQINNNINDNYKYYTTINTLKSSKKNLFKNVEKYILNTKNTITIRNKKKLKKIYLSKFWYLKLNKYSWNYSKFKFKSNRRIALKSTSTKYNPLSSSSSSLKLIDNKNSRNLFRIAYLHKKNFHNANKIISMNKSKYDDEQQKKLIIDSFQYDNNYKTKINNNNNQIIINNENDHKFDKLKLINYNHNQILKKFNCNFLNQNHITNDNNNNKIFIDENINNKCHNYSYYLNIVSQSQRPVKFFNNDMNNQNDLKTKNGNCLYPNSNSKGNSNTKICKNNNNINNRRKQNNCKNLKDTENLCNLNSNDKKSKKINLKKLSYKNNIIINLMKCALNNIKNFLFINCKISKYNDYKYHVYLSLLILQLLMTTQCVLGYSTNIMNNQTIQHQLQQQHHYLTSSSSSSNLATSTSTRTQSLLSSPLLSSSSSSSSLLSSSSVSVPAAAESSDHQQQQRSSSSSSSFLSFPTAGAAAAPIALSEASGDSTMNSLRNQHSTSATSEQHHSDDITDDNLNSESRKNINNFELIGRENLIRREPNLSYTPNGCHTCQLREQAKADNLASIKNHILMRLKLDKMPNITSPIVPREIIEKFYKNNSNMFNKNNHNHNYYNSAGIGSGSNNLNRSGSEQIFKNHNNMRNNGDTTNRHTRRMINSQKSFDDMQGDDPRMYGNEDDNYDYNVNDEENNGNEDYEEEFYSIVNSLYVFPTVSKIRHNRKPDILQFTFTNNGHSTISQAILHLYIHGRDWIHEYEPTIFNDKNENNRRDIVMTINRVLRRPNSNSTHTQKVIELRQQIPNGIGSWIQIDVTDMVSGWYNNAATNYGLVIKTTEAWMKDLIVIEDSSGSKPIYIEILTKDNRKRRTKRNTSLNCSESDNEVRCCRYPLEVDFRKFNWDWIIAPTSFNAYFCNGECKLGFLQRYPHTHIMQLSTAPQPCCSPTKMSPISLLYFNNEQTLVMSTIPNMAVDKCSCS